MRQADLWLSVILIIAGVAIWDAAYRRRTREALANSERFLSLHWWIPGLRASELPSAARLAIGGA